MAGGFFNRQVRLHIGTEGNQDSHGNGERIEHLSHGGNHRHPGEVLDIGNQEILYSRHSSLSGHGIDRKQNCQNHQNRHHKGGYLFDSIFHSHKDNPKHQQGKNQKPKLRLYPISDKCRKVLGCGHGFRFSLDIAEEIFAYPTADDGIIGYNQDGDNGINPASCLEHPVLSKVGISSHGALSGHSTNGTFRNYHGVTKGKHQKKVNQKEDSPSVFRRQIRESPNISQAHRRACGG